jgi:GxxExxY protein
MLPQVKLSKAFLKDITYKINGAAIEIHKTIGPGLLESVYHKCMEHELELRDLNFVTEMLVPLNYKNLSLDAELRCDLFVESCIVVELKTVDQILPIHKAQILTYMKILRAPKGILINFNAHNLYQEGQETFVNEFFTNLDES